MVARTTRITFSMSQYPTVLLPVTPTLYKYLTASGAISLIVNRQFWFRCPLQFEPRDCRADLLENLDLHETRSALRREMERFLCDATAPAPPYHPMGPLLQALRTRAQPWTAVEVETTFGWLFKDVFENLDEHRNWIKREQERVLTDVRVLCLCENDASPAMWKQYADNGRGVCIGFRYVPEIDNSLGAARRVEYVDKWPVIATPLEWARHILCFDKIPFDKRAGDALYMKLRQFSYEQEWRVVTKTNPGTHADADGVYRITLDPPEVVEIILGSFLSACDESKLRAVLRTVCPHAVIRTSGIEWKESAS